METSNDFTNERPNAGTSGLSRFFNTAQNEHSRNDDSVKKFNSVMQERYENDLLNACQRGEGAHSWMMGAANHGILAGLTPEQVFSDIRHVLDKRVPDNEIWKTIKTALLTHGNGNFVFKPKPKPIVNDGNEVLKRIIESGTIHNDVELRESSPIRLPDNPQEDAALFVETMFDQSDFLFIGGEYETKAILPCCEWAQNFKTVKTAGPFIIVNPLDGMLRPKKSGDGGTYRGDSNVKAFRHCLVEFDNLSREEQIRFWSAVKLPIKALIDTGNKSIHAWIDVPRLATVNNLNKWESEIKNRLYDRILAPLGVDAACKNPARLSRSPGCFRAEKGKYQRLLWLSPEGREVS